MRGWLFLFAGVWFVAHISTEIDMQIRTDTKLREQAAIVWNDYAQDCASPRALFKETCEKVWVDYQEHKEVDSQARVAQRVLNTQWDKRVRPVLDPIASTAASLIQFVGSGFNVTVDVFVLTGDTLRECRKLTPAIAAPGVVALIVLLGVWLFRYATTHVVATLVHIASFQKPDIKVTILEPKALKCDTATEEQPREHPREYAQRV
jgi:hypothetical protein